MSTCRRQRGRSFLIVLIALAIVAWLSRDALLGYLGSINDAAPQSSSRLPQAAQPAVDASQATPTFNTPVERARAVEDVVRQQYEQSGRRIDGAAR
ncbi:MAG TPA: hypothetical protein VNE58_14880 [Casimicrobiaceae bacterium]|nr:hypothetical protein [Casimicrobiaceae bacterium]